MGALVLFLLALGIPCLVIGCGGGESSQQTPAEAAQTKKAQQYLSNYSEQMIEANKAKAKAAGKHSP
jgi:hypothetical protein